MATRFYLPSSGSIGVSPAYNTAWDDSTTWSSRLPMSTSKTSTSMTSVSVTGDADKTQKSYLLRQFISEPLNAQTIQAQTVRIQIRCSETNDLNNLYLHIGIRSWDGSTFQSLFGVVALTAGDSLTEFTTTLTNRIWFDTTTSTTVSTGDRLVLDIGISGDPAQNGSDYHNCSLSIGDDSGTDLPENNSETAAYNAWLEFETDTISFYSASAIQTINGLAKASVSSVNGLAIASVKSWNGLE